MQTKIQSVAGAVLPDARSALLKAKSLASRHFSFRAFALMLLLIATSSFADAAADMADGVDAAITGMETIIVTIGKALLGVAVLYAIYRGVRKLLG
ncbi:MAG: major capsid protein [Fibromonadaceae bacterium]|jgi:hypothetical protein|nr:major capsid protein [Fibromonadaceae bacterium]